jgi:glycosyltransferase involved in cell wall biosynthesis
VWFVPGFLKQDELAQVYASVDVVASASTFETFGFTALEAMACGTPFLGPRAQGFRDVVEHGKVREIGHRTRLQGNVRRPFLVQLS